MTPNLIDEENRTRERIGGGTLTLIAFTVVAFIVMLFVETCRTDTATMLLSEFLILALVICAVDALATVRGKGVDTELNRRFGRIAFIGGVAASMIALVLNFVAEISVDALWQTIFWRVAVALAASVVLLVCAILVELVLRATQKKEAPSPDHD